MTEGEREAAVERAVRRMRAYRSGRQHRDGMFRGVPAGEGLPEPEDAGTTWGVNCVWIALAREAIARAFGHKTEADPSPREHRRVVYGTGIQRRQGES